MKSRVQFGAAAIALLALVGLACTFQSVDIFSSPNASQTQGSNGNPTASPSPSVPGCEVQSLGISLKGNPGVFTIPVNSDEVLDATPRGVDGKPLPDQCAPPAIAWKVEADSTAQCNLSNPNDYGPTLRASTTGTCKVKADAAGRSAFATFTVE